MHLQNLVNFQNTRNNCKLPPMQSDYRNNAVHMQLPWLAISEQLLFKHRIQSLLDYNKAKLISNFISS